MSNPAINSIEDAKNYAIDATNRRLSPEEATNKLSEYRKNLAKANHPDDQQYWQEYIGELEKWLDSDNYKQGTYPQGIDSLIFELVEWRSSIQAFQEVELSNEQFRSSHFFALWQSGAAYAIACILGKLTSKHPKDNSLSNVWKCIMPYIVEDMACSEEEAATITQKLHRTEGHFTNANSKAMLLRNKIVAHNEWSPRIEWSDLDRDIEILARVWAIIVGFCSYGVLFPFPQPDTAFNGLGNTISPMELENLRKERSLYIDRFRIWTRKNLATGGLDSRSPAFAEISITSQLVSHDNNLAI